MMGLRYSRQSVSILLIALAAVAVLLVHHESDSDYTGLLEAAAGESAKLSLTSLPQMLIGIPIQIQCNNCRASLQAACSSNGGYPTCTKVEAVAAALSDCHQKGMNTLKGVLVCPGDAQVSQAEECAACRFRLQSTCSANGGFPSCLATKLVKEGFHACATQTGLQRLPESKALNCAGESQTVIGAEGEGFLCDACREQLQGSCQRKGSYPKCLRDSSVKAQLQLCVQRSGLKLVEGRLYCKGDTIMRMPVVSSKMPSKQQLQEADAQTPAPHESYSQDPVPARDIVSPSLVETAAVATKAVMKPPAAFTCMQCRDHLSCACAKMGGFDKCRAVEEFNRILNSCRKYRSLSFHNNAMHCADDQQVRHNSAKTATTQHDSPAVAFPQISQSKASLDALPRRMTSESRTGHSTVIPAAAASLSKTNSAHMIMPPPVAHQASPKAEAHTEADQEKQKAAAAAAKTVDLAYQKAKKAAEEAQKKAAVAAAKSDAMAESLESAWQKDYSPGKQ